MNLEASPSGRPGLFAIMRDDALERADAASVAKADRLSELWHRAPEEWELVRRKAIPRYATLESLGWSAPLDMGEDFNFNARRFVTQKGNYRCVYLVTAEFVANAGMWHAAAIARRALTAEAIKWESL